MSKLSLAICLVIVAVFCGCSPRGTASADKQIESQWGPAQSSHIRVQVEPLTQIPNNGLQLPAVSPDGKWIAYLDFHSDEPIELAGLFTGRGLQPMSLYVRPVTQGAKAKLVCESGAAWPAWSPDNKKLVFVAYDEVGQCRLGIYDVGTGTTRYVSTGQKHIMMLTVSPSGKEAVLVVPGTTAKPSSLYVLNLDTSKVEQICKTNLQGSKFWPQWTRDGRIIFVLCHDGRSWLAQCWPGKFPPEKLCEIGISPSQIGMFQALAGLGKPLSPDDKHFAYYDTMADRIVLLRLLDGQQIKLPADTRAGCWLDSRRFVAADEKQMRLFTIPPTAPALLMRGSWLPLNGNPHTGEIILCTRGRHRSVFSLVRMRLLPSS